jgi:hypothetical protein
MPLVIKRGSSTIADGNTAKVDGCPLAECEQEMDFVRLIRGAATQVFDRTTKTGGLTFSIVREFGSHAAALHHAFMVPAAGTGVADFVVEYNDGTDTHVWTLDDAGWPSITVEEVSGVHVRTSYTVSGGVFAYSGGDLTTPYSEAIA